MSGTATKKFRSKFFRIAVEGDATDGRVIESAWLQQMADSYNPNTYAARIWMEHIRSMLPDGPFRAYGDVTALKVDSVEINGQKKLALFAQIEPTDDLVNIVNVQKQKLYTSMELDTQFAGTGKAYLTGLGVTDSPASLGTERLAFSAKHPEAALFAERKQKPDNLFSAAQEVTLVFDEVAEDESAGNKLFALLAGLAERFSPTTAKPAEPVPEAATGDFSEIGKALVGIGKHAEEQDRNYSALQHQFREQNAALQSLRADFASLKAELGSTPAGDQRPRPVSTGNSGPADLTDC